MMVDFEPLSAYHRTLLEACGLTWQRGEYAAGLEPDLNLVSQFDRTVYGSVKYRPSPSSEAGWWPQSEYLERELLAKNTFGQWPARSAAMDALLGAVVLVHGQRNEAMKVSFGRSNGEIFEHLEVRSAVGDKWFVEVTLSLARKWIVNSRNITRQTFTTWPRALIWAAALAVELARGGPVEVDMAQLERARKALEDLP